MDTVTVARTFKYKNRTLPDPNPELSPEQVKQFHAQAHPELASAAIEGPETRRGGASLHLRAADRHQGVSGASERAAEPHPGRRRVAQHPRGPGVPRRRRTRRAEHRAGPTLSEEREGRLPPAPLALPAHAGLRLPKLNVPSNMVVERNGHACASFALALIEAGLLEDGEQTGAPNALIQGALAPLLPDLDELEIDYNLGVVGGETMLWLEVGCVSVFEITSFAARCDAVDERLGPSILSRLYGASLNPPFIPQLAYETVDMHYWMGEGDDSALQDEAAYALARGLAVDRATLSDADVAAYAASHYFTQTTLDELLEPRYQMSGELSIDDCIRLCEPRCDALTSICRLIKTIDALTDAVPHYRNAWEVFDEAAQLYPFVLTLPRGSGDVVYEMACERDQYAMEVGQALPIYVMPLGPNAASVARLKASLSQLKEVFTLENALYQVLRSLG